VFRVSGDGEVEVLLAHPGGPFWARKDLGAWSVPKGEYGADEGAIAAAYREFREETGLAPPDGTPLELGARVQAGGKRVSVWALEGDPDVTGAHSNTFELEWPRGSGRIRSYPEIDRLEWMPLARARTKLLKGQVPFLDDLLAVLAATGRVTKDGGVDEVPPPG